MKRLLLLIAMMVAGYSFTWAQRDVTGQVFDNENRTPLQGISITLKNTRIGTTTDADGNFAYQFLQAQKLWYLHLPILILKKLHLLRDKMNTWQHLIKMWWL